VPRSSNAYFASLLDAFEEIAAAQGYELMQVLSRHDAALELRRIEALISRRVDGLLVVPVAEASPTFDLLARSRLPVVMVDRASADMRFDYVTLDDYGAMCMATRALVDAGHRHLMFLMRYPGLITTRERTRGFRETIAGVASAIGEELARDPDDARFAQALLAQLQRTDRPTALIASNSDLALDIMRVLRRARLRCPQDVSLLAFDAATWADVLTPPLAVVRQPTRLLASRAWQVLLERMEHREMAPQRIVLPATLELRASVAPPPASRMAHVRRKAALRKRNP
jgi:LacI family transcriptional regulator, galactose operon repressor